jgi:hypothetical protein
VVIGSFSGFMAVAATGLAFLFVALAVVDLGFAVELPNGWLLSSGSEH